ncbi:MAG: cation:proton antiporter [Nitrospinae bacterium]|nr:cation:proton antiporter [Nitrospinota bacterium]
MENFTLIFDVLIIYCAVIISVIIAKKFKQSNIVAYLIAGIIIGPSLLHLVNDKHDVQMLAEVGVVFFLFIIGLEFPLSKLSEMKRMIFGIGGLQVLLSSIVFYLFFIALGFSHPTAILLGTILSLSSTAIVLKMLVERAAMDSLFGKSSLSILLFQDLMIVPIMLLIPILSGNSDDSPLMLLGITLGKTLLIIVVLFLLAHYVFRPLITFIAVQRSSELFVVTVLFICLGTAVLTNETGFSLILGAFVAGLVLSETDFKHQITADFLPIRDCLLPIFFVSVGMLVDIGYVLHHLPQVVGLFIFIMLMKIVVLMLVLRIMGYSLKDSIMISLTLAQVGELAFVLLLGGHLAGIISENLYQTSLSAIVLSMLVTPFIMNKVEKWGFYFSEIPFFYNLFPAPELEKVDKSSDDMEDHVIVCGYGVTGRYVVKSLDTFDIPHVVLDVNWSNVELGQKEGKNIHFGDAAREEILVAAGIKKAKAVVLTFHGLDSIKGIIKEIRELNKKVLIMVRSQFVSNLAELEVTGADLVVTEEFQTSLHFISELLGKFDFGPGEIKMLIDDIMLDRYALFKQDDVDSGEETLSTKKLDE